LADTSSAIFEAKRRAKDYWNIDGLPALLKGATTVLVGVVCLATNRHWSAWDLFWLCFFLSILLEGKKTLEWLKGRITYPRTGYVGPPEEAPYVRRDPFTIISIIKEPEEPPARTSQMAIGLAYAPFLFLVLWIGDDAWIVALLCFATAIDFWTRFDDPPWFEITGMILAGLASVILPMDGPHRFAIILLVFGASGMVKGATLLIRYLRGHPAPQG
jgi:hypothetical protein